MRLDLRYGSFRPSEEELLAVSRDFAYCNDVDRLDAMKAIVTALDAGSLAGGGRRLGRSPAAMTRAIDLLERHAGTALLERTTRRLRLTQAGEEFVAVARRILAEVEALNMMSAAPSGLPRGQLTLTAPLVAGVQILRPVVDAYLDRYPDVQAELLLSDRQVNLLEEGIDVALRIAPLGNSSLVAFPLGSVRRVVCAAPAYLDKQPPILSPNDLSTHRTIAIAETGRSKSWSFPAVPGKSGGQSIQISSRLSVNSIEAAKGSAVAGNGVARLLSYQINDEVRDGRLRIVLEAFEPRLLPVHLLASKNRLAVARTRCFVDMAVPLLRPAFGRATSGAL